MYKMHQIRKSQSCHLKTNKRINSAPDGRRIFLKKIAERERIVMSENYLLKTEWGSVYVTKNAMGKVIKEAVSGFDGKVAITNQKGKLASLVSRFGYGNEISFMDIDCEEGYPTITVYVAIKLGTSIAATTNKLIEDIHEGFEKKLGFPPESVAIIVTGMISKNIARRNIEVVKKYDV